MTFVWITSYLFAFVMGGIVTLSTIMYIANRSLRTSKSKITDRPMSPTPSTFGKEEVKVGPNPFEPTILKYH